MSRTRGIFALQLAVGLCGAAVTGLALWVLAGAITLQSPSTAALAEACRSFVLPQPSLEAMLALMLGSVAFAVLILAARSLRRRLQASRRIVRSLRVIGYQRGRAIVFADPQPLAFCAGLLRPRVYVSTGAIDALSPPELEAVLAHEAHHVRCRDPLRIVIARVLADALFFLPVLRDLAARYEALAEIAADAAAVRRHGGDRSPLAGALLAFDERASSAVVAIAPERVDHLLGQRPRWEVPVALLGWATVIVAASVIVALRVDQATAHATVSLPLVAAQLCMVAMAALPLIAGAAALLGARRGARFLRR